MVNRGFVLGLAALALAGLIAAAVVVAVGRERAAREERRRIEESHSHLVSVVSQLETLHRMSSVELPRGEGNLAILTSFVVAAGAARPSATWDLATLRVVPERNTQSESFSVSLSSSWTWTVGDLDAWGRPIAYRCPGRRYVRSWELVSLGPNGEDDGGHGDDLVVGGEER